jgi:hypothetical protein
VSWLERETGFKAWPYEADILDGCSLSLRVIRKSRQIGITTTIAHEAIWKAYTTPDRVILIVSPSDRQSKIVMTRIEAIVDMKPRLYERVVKKNTSELTLDNRSKILSLPNNPDRLRGFSATDIYLDVRRCALPERRACDGCYQANADCDEWPLHDRVDAIWETRPLLGAVQVCG